MLRSLTRLSLACALVTCLSTSSLQAQFADLEGQIVLMGELPSVKNKVEQGDPAARDAQVCAAEAIPYYNLTIDPESKGVADVFVYVRRVSKVKPGLEAVPTEELVVDQKNCMFIPHAAIVRCKQQVVAKSQDAVPHNLNGATVINPGFNFTVGANDRVGVKVDITKANTRPEPLPVLVKCDIHPHMQSYWLITDNPYAAITDANGKFKIEGLPVGKHEVTFWHSTSGFLFGREVAGAAGAPPRLVRTMEIEVKADGTKLDPLEITASSDGVASKLVPVMTKLKK